MSSHHHHHEECCYPMTMGYGMGGYSGGAGYSGGGAAWGIRWIYALLILIVIVLQFGRRTPFYGNVGTGCCSETAAAKDETAVAALPGFGFLGGYGGGFESIDRSVLFIIVVFLLVLCGGCFFGGYGGGTGYGGYSGGCGGMY